MTIKTILNIASAFGISACLASMPANASHSDVEDALRNHPEFSSFYQALMDTGVMSELQSGVDYTVFAPTNEAFAALIHDHSTCFNSMECKAEMASIVRNHIVPGDIRVSDVALHQGGLFSLGHRFTPIGRPNRSDYTVEGQIIHYTATFNGGRLYTVDGIIANKYELESLNAAIPHVQVSRHKTTIPDPACGEVGCPDALTETTTTYHSIIVP